MKQLYETYTPQDHLVWKTLFDRQQANLQDKSSKEYLHCLSKLSTVLHGNRVPNFDDLNAQLKVHTGWSIEVVPGLIEVDLFFKLLAQQRFCSSTWLRNMSQLDYLEEPDMFHDIFGHIPLFMDQRYARFAQKMGEVGVHHINNKEVLLQLQRIYWFTIEFGLIKHPKDDTPRIYGAGIISSFGESNGIFENDIDISPFDLEVIIQTPFKTDEIQTRYFILESMDQLYQSFDRYSEVLLAPKTEVGG